MVELNIFMKYYILDSNNNMIAIPFDTAEEAESFGVNGGWDTFTIIKMVKLVKK